MSCIPFEPMVYSGHNFFDVNRAGLRCYGFRRAPYGNTGPGFWSVFYPVGMNTVTATAVVDDFGSLVVVS